MTSAGGITPAGAITIIAVLTQLGTLTAAWLSMNTMKRGIAKENANRRITLEEYTIDVDRYHRDLRAYLFQLAEDGVIDIGRVDLSRFRPPPVPKYNGNGK